MPHKHGACYATLHIATPCLKAKAAGLETCSQALGKLPVSASRRGFGMVSYLARR